MFKYGLSLRSAIPTPKFDASEEESTESKASHYLGMLAQFVSIFLLPYVSSRIYIYIDIDTHTLTCYFREQEDIDLQIILSYQLAKERGTSSRAKTPQ